MTISQNISRALGAAAATGLLALTTFTPALAHDSLVSSNPEDGAQLEQAPDQISMTFSGEITQVDGGNQVRVTDSAGEDVTNGDLTVDGKQVTQPIAGHGAEDDTYTVTWRVVSEDGHPIEGQQTLTVGEGKSAAEESSAAASDEAEEASQPVEEATQGMSTGAKIGLFVLGAAVIIGAFVVILAKRPKNK